MPIAVERAETFYLPPPDMPPDAWALVMPAERVFRWVEKVAQRRITPPQGFLIGQQVYARVNHNRWLADCPCGSAAVVSPADPRFACTECRFGWAVVVFPDDPDAVEAGLVGLLPHERNWRHDDDPDRPGAQPDPVPPAGKEG